MNKNNEFYKQILDNIKDGVYFVDPERRILYWNKGAEQITGFPAEKVVGSFCYDNILNHVTENGTQLCFGGCPLHATIQDGKPRQAEVFLHHADGHRLPVLVRTSPMHDRSGEITGAVEIFSNNVPTVVMRRRVDRLEKAVMQDFLTGIGNRRSMEMHLKSALENCRGNQGQCGLLLMDIDLFKEVNDTYGHKIGDQVLVMVAQTLKQNIRADDALARWGGEEFILLLLDIEESDLFATAEKLRCLVEQSHLRLKGKDIGVTVSIGATAIGSEDTINSVIERADRNMYHSKHAGRNQVSLDKRGAKKGKE